MIYYAQNFSRDRTWTLFPTHHLCGRTNQPWSCHHDSLSFSSGGLSSTGAGHTDLGDGLTQTTVKCQHLLVFAAPHMGLEGIPVAAEDITELAVVLTALDLLGDCLLL